MKMVTPRHSGVYQSVPVDEASRETPSTSPAPQDLRLLFKTLAACLSWLVCSSTIILVNKYIMVDLHFKYPMAVAAMGMFVASVVAYLYCDVAQQVPAVKGMDSRFYWTRVFPVGACQGFTLFLGNILYLYLTVAFIEMSRASLPVTTMIGLWLARLDTPTTAVIRAVVLTAAGCAVAAYGEVHLSLIGAMLMASNLVMETVRLVMTQFLLTGCDMHPMQSLKYIAPAATATLLVGSYFKEYPEMLKHNSLATINKYPMHFLLAACMGLVVNVLGVIIMKLSSATTMKVLAAVRGPIVVFCGILLFAEHVSTIEFVGYSIALVGFVWYNYAKATQVVAKALPKA